MREEKGREEKEREKRILKNERKKKMNIVYMIMKLTNLP